METHDHFNCCISLYVGDKTAHVFHARELDDDEFLREVNRVVPAIVAEIDDSTEAVGLDVEMIVPPHELSLPPEAEKPSYARIRRLMDAIRESLVQHGLSADRVRPGTIL